MSKYFALKAWPVRILGAMLLVLASPILLFLVILVRLTSSGPGLFQQARSGRHGREFMMYKLRTMYNNAESVTGPVWCAPGDSRITPVGRILRLLHLDELPQLINVARGEMDLIGPRPERPVFVSRLNRYIPDYESRLRVLPGVTGLAQINLPPDETINCVRRKLVLDCAYINEAGLFLDLRILLCTFLRMIGIRHGYAAKWLGVRRHVHFAVEPVDKWGGYADFADQAGTAPAAASLWNGSTSELALVAADAANPFATTDPALSNGVYAPRHPR